jgi:hypothetical protein
LRPKNVLNFHFATSGNFVSAIYADKECSPSAKPEALRATARKRRKPLRYRYLHPKRIFLEILRCESALLRTI